MDKTFLVTVGESALKVVATAGLTAFGTYSLTSSVKAALVAGGSSACAAILAALGVNGVKYSVSNQPTQAKTV